jgi:hypothetical protein
MKQTLVCVSIICMVIATSTIGARLVAQTRGRGAGPPFPGRSSASATRVEGSLLQVMRGIVYPASNVVFAGQGDLSKLPKAEDPATSPNPLTSTYGEWVAVENASIALAESANLLLVPGRTCSNRKPVPVRRADWIKFVNDLRVAGQAAYNAAQSKNQETMVEASGTVADACQASHDVYRERRGPAGRCSP